MAYKKVGKLYWPMRPAAWLLANAMTVDAANEAAAFIGQVRWADGASHTIDTTGSSKIYVHTGSAATFDDATSVMHIGIQDVDTTTGVPVRPDGTYDVNSVVTTAADTSPALTTQNSFVGATPTTGTKTIAHGDLIAVVCTLITVGTTPAANVNFMGQTTSELGANGGRPCGIAYTGSWAHTMQAPVILLVASDGTFGTFEGVTAFGQFSTLSYADSSNPDEYGNIFQVPFACKVNGFSLVGGAPGATADFQYDLTSTPTGTPASLISGPISVTAESIGGSSTTGTTIMFPEVALAADTDYCISIKATAAGFFSMYNMTLPQAGARALLRGGTATYGASRNGGSGAYSTSDTAIRAICVNISEIDFPAGGGGGGGTHFSVGG
jgi:hypothetical protein